MELVLLTRKPCELCAEFEEALAAVLEILAARGRDATYVERDVDADPELQRRYGHHVPVLLLDGAVLSAHRLDAARVAAALDGKAWEPLDLR